MTKYSTPSEEWLRKKALEEDGCEIGAGMPDHPLRVPEATMTDRVEEIEGRHKAFDSTGQKPKTEDGRAMMERVESMAFATLCGANRTDMEVAFEIATVSRHDLNLVAAQTTAKDRVRWLSAQLARAHQDREFLLSTIRALQAEAGELRGRLDATKCTNNSPGRLTGFRQVEHPCEDCIDDWCQMNCGPATPSLEKDND